MLQAGKSKLGNGKTLIYLSLSQLQRSGKYVIDKGFTNNGTITFECI